MALSLVRLLQAKHLTGCAFRCQFYPLVRCVTLKATSGQQCVEENFDDRNARLKRPQSPHLTIYKPQLTSMMSISHRITGMAMGTYLTALGFGALVLPNDIPVYIQWIQDQHFSGALIFLAKSAIAFPFAYHYCNGIRHLVWDMGKGLTLKSVYQTGYVVLAASGLVTLWLLSR